MRDVQGPAGDGHRSGLGGSGDGAGPHAGLPCSGEPPQGCGSGRLGGLGLPWYRAGDPELSSVPRASLLRVAAPCSLGTVSRGLPHSAPPAAVPTHLLGAGRAAAVSSQPRPRRPSALWSHVTHACHGRARARVLHSPCAASRRLVPGRPAPGCSAQRHRTWGQLTVRSLRAFGRLWSGRRSS